jgi:hypothetical protein
MRRSGKSGGGTCLNVSNRRKKKLAKVSRGINQSQCTDFNQKAFRSGNVKFVQAAYLPVDYPSNFSSMRAQA